GGGPGAATIGGGALAKSIVGGFQDLKSARALIDFLGKRGSRFWRDRHIRGAVPGGAVPRHIGVLYSVRRPSECRHRRTRRQTPVLKWPRGGVVTQRSAKPCTPVQFRAWPPINSNT